MISGGKRWPLSRLDQEKKPAIPVCLHIGEDGEFTGAMQRSSLDRRDSASLDAALPVQRAFRTGDFEQIVNRFDPRVIAT
jgi:hypothetical protein